MHYIILHKEVREHRYLDAYMAFLHERYAVIRTTILSQRKAGPWKRDVEKKKGTDSILCRIL